MIDFHSAIIHPPHPNSAAWYIQYYSAFNLSQITNNVLFMYLHTFCENSFINQKGHYEKIERMDIFHNEISDAIDEAMTEMQARIQSHLHIMLCGGIQLKNIPTQYQIDKDTLLSSVNTNNWYELLKGFLNVWEFLFLFSITETALKKALGTDLAAFKLIDEINFKYVNFFQNRKYTYSFEMTNSLWKLYTKLRNVYAHKHGFFDEEDLIKIKKDRKIFLKIYNGEIGLLEKTFFSLEKKDFFKTKNYTKSKFCLITDTELNIFKFCTSNLLYQLSLANQEAN
ncbi:hypothetical protein [Acinetobacter beijerinckii]|uniref:hypothetical protein n=1 Tax=Acinetobacter beijerinckii TaxID=262668 RepID=UPI0030DDDC51